MRNNHRLGAVAVFGAGQRALLALLVVAVTSACGVTAFSLSYLAEQRQLQTEMQGVMRALGETLNGAAAKLDALVGAHQAEAFVGDDADARLSTAARHYLSRSDYLELLGYAKRVAFEERGEFVAALREQGFVQYRIKDLLPGGGYRVSAGRADYLPLNFIEPMTPTLATLLGLDLREHTAVAGLVERSVASGLPAASAARPLAVVDDDANAPHRSRSRSDRPRPDRPRPDAGGARVLLAAATYYGLEVPQTEAQRRLQYSGAFFFQIDVARLFADLAAEYPGIALTASVGGTAQPLFSGADAAAWLPLPPLAVHQRLPFGGVDVTVSTRRPGTGSYQTLLPALATTLLTLTLLLALVRLERTRRLRRLQESEHRRELFCERERADVTLKSIADAVITFDRGGRVTYMNPVAVTMLGHDVAGRGATLPLYNENDGVPLPVAADALFARLRDPSGLLLRASDGAPVDINHTASTLRDDCGNDIGLVLVLRDVSRERELTRRLAFHAEHDALTGLKNRRVFEQSVCVALERARRTGVASAVMYLDLDQFKLINDTCGHVAGDEVLRQVTGLFQTQLRTGDLLARLGGDEFGIVMSDCGKTCIETLAARLHRVLADYRYYANDKVFTVGVSVGALLIDGASGAFDDVMSALDMACYTAKDRGRNQLYLCCDGDRVIDDRQREMSWHGRVQAALDEGRFELYWQPIRQLACNGGPSRLYEFLVRMRLSSGELAPPMAFLGAAERFGLMARIDRWIIDRALSLIGATVDAGDNVVYTINLSGQTIGSADISDYVLDRLREHGVAPRRVCFEITETAAIANMNQARTVIAALRAVGCYFALDDFGSGLSSFGYLKHLPVDFLKIDGQFVRGVENDEIAAEMLKAIYGVGRAMGILTIAEGIENEAALRRVAAVGIDYAQGYHLGRPGPASAQQQRAAAGQQHRADNAKKRLPAQIRLNTAAEV